MYHSLSVLLRKSYHEDGYFFVETGSCRKIVASEIRTLYNNFGIMEDVSMGREFELKYASDPVTLAAIRRESGGNFREISMLTTYFDTALR